MKNISETRTENFFRQEYGTTTFIEKSAIPSKYGFYSKKGTNYKGYPDFFLDQGEYCIVVEAKAENHLQAENEVKYYMLKNKISSDIVGIAVSGQSKKTLSYTYFIKFAGEKILNL